MLKFIHQVLGRPSRGGDADPFGDPLAKRLIPRIAGARVDSPLQWSGDGHQDLIIQRQLAQAHPDVVFDQLRWGGQVVFVSPREREVDHCIAMYCRRPEFCLEQSPQVIHEPWGSALRHLRRPRHRFIVLRKVMIERPDDLTIRHSHDLRLAADQSPHARDGYVVSKRVPTIEQTVARLYKMRPTIQEHQATRLAAKLVNKVFPIFLTREAAFLKLLRGRMPAPLRGRVPGFVRMEQDERGLVRRLDMSWLRLGGRSMGLIEFARQAATILHALHFHVGMLHLDLRLENMVITDHGVSLIDFGSSIMAGENLAQSNLLNTLHTEMLNASRPAAQLRRLQGTGMATSSLFDACYAQRQPAIDLFCLAWFMTRPHANPDFRPLVRYRDDDPDVQRLLALQRLTLAPPNPQRPAIRSIRDLLDTLQSSRLDQLDPDTPAITRSPFDIGGATIGDMTADDSHAFDQLTATSTAAR